jgi:hypothetical protein
MGVWGSIHWELGDKTETSSAVNKWYRWLFRVSTLILTRQGVSHDLVAPLIFGRIEGFIGFSN